MKVKCRAMDEATSCTDSLNSFSTLGLLFVNPLHYSVNLKVPFKVQILILRLFCYTNKGSLMRIIKE